MIQSLAGVGCLCMHKCPNSGDLDMEPFTNVFLGEGSKGTSAKLSKERVGFPLYTSKSLHALWCLVCNRYPTAQMNGTYKSTKLRRRRQCPHWFETQVLDHSIAYTEAHRATVSLPQPSPSSYIGIEFVFSDTFCTQAQKLP